MCIYKGFENETTIRSTPIVSTPHYTMNYTKYSKHNRNEQKEQVFLLVCLFVCLLMIKENVEFSSTVFNQVTRSPSSSNNCQFKILSR